MLYLVVLLRSSCCLVAALPSPFLLPRWGKVDFMAPEPSKDTMDHAKHSFSFTEEVSKPDISEGLWDRKDALSTVLRNICEYADSKDHVKLATTALEEFSTSVLELLDNTKDDHEKSGMSHNSDGNDY